MRRGLRRLLWSLAALLLILLAVPLSAYALLASESGSRWLLQQAAGRLSGDELRIGLADSEGRLIDRLTLHEVKVSQAGMEVAIERLTLAWRPTALIDRVLQIDALEVTGVDIVAPPAAEDEPAAVPQLPDLALPIAIRLDRLALERVSLVGQAIVERASLSARLDNAGLALSELAFAGSGIELAGQATMGPVAPHALAGGLRFTVSETLTGADVGPVEGEAVLGGGALRPEVEVGLSKPRPFELRALLELDRADPAFDLRGAWPALAWPLHGKPQVALTAGRLSLKGTADAYRLELDTALSGEGIPPSRVDLRGDGNLQGLRLAPLQLATLDGRIDAAGSLQWSPALRWDLRLDLDRIDPGRYHADYPGRISGRVMVEGRMRERAKDPLTLRARFERLGGELRGQALTVAGELELDGRRLLARDLALGSGENRLSLNGTADRAFDLRFGISAPDLAALYPGLAGQLHGGGTVTGSRDQPTVAVDLSGDGLRLSDSSVGQLQLRADWREQGGSANLQLASVQVAGQTVSTLDAVLRGEPARHRLEVSLQAPGLVTQLAAAGGLEEAAWRGQLEQLLLSEANVGEWQLPAPAELQLGSERAKVGRLCLAQDTQQLCLAGGWQAADGLAVEGSLAAVSLTRLSRLLSGDAIVDGRLDGRFTVSGQPGNPLVDLELLPGDGVIRVEAGDEPFEVAYSGARLSARLRDDVGDAELRLELGAGGQARGRLRLGADRAGDRSLDGELVAAFPDLALVAGFVPVLEAVKGSLRIDTRIGGTLAAPDLRGGLQIVEASARVPAAGIELQAIGVEVRGDGRSPLAVDGSLRSGEGTLTLDGSYDLGSGRVDLRIEGKDLQAVRLPEAEVAVSPELRLQGQDRLQLSGRIHIPRAKIELKEIPAGSVSVSDDEIIVDGTGAATAKPTALPLQARVQVSLGDAVSFKGFGLQTRLEGGLDTTVDRGETRVDGKIELKEASYKAYGQDLTVERGRLLFAGTPGNPELDLRALRVSRDGQVKAYLAMSGPLRKPRPRIYSEPTLPEAEALAYLLTGNGLSQADRAEGLDIAGAALSLGIAKGEPLLQDMSDRLGIDELRVESGENGLADSSLVVGKYLNPDLYLGYSQGLFNPEGAVLLRLRLSERLEVESRSGVEQSVDLFYRVEHD